MYAKIRCAGNIILYPVVADSISASYPMRAVSEMRTGAPLRYPLGKAD